MWLSWLADQQSTSQNGWGSLFERVAINCSSIRWTRDLARDFREVISSKDRDGMLNWMWTAAHSGIGPVVRFAYGLKQDLDAAVAAVDALEQRPD